MSTNPLLQDWTAPFDLPPFGQLRPEHFEPAMRAAMQAHRDEPKKSSYPGAASEGGGVGRPIWPTMRWQM